MGTGRFSGGGGTRGMGALANYFGKKMKPLLERGLKFKEALSRVNPNYGNGDEYSTNCALCVSAAALQMMGYDVEAMPRSKTWRGFDSVFDYKWIPENFVSPNDRFVNYSGVPFDKNDNNTNRFTSSTVEGVMNQIELQMNTWGNKSFAAMNVSWMRRGAHVVIVRKDAFGVTHVTDFQTHQDYTLQGWFKAHPTAKPDSIGLYRLDNQRIRSSIKDVDKIIKRRS